MEEVLVEIQCPATGKTYEFRVPKQMQVSAAARRIAEDIMGFESNNTIFDLNEKIVLFNYNLRSIVNEVYTVTEAGVESGTTLMIL